MAREIHLSSINHWYQTPGNTQKTDIDIRAFEHYGTRLVCELTPGLLIPNFGLNNTSKPVNTIMSVG